MIQIVSIDEELEVEGGDKSGYFSFKFQRIINLFKHVLALESIKKEKEITTCEPLAETKVPSPPMTEIDTSDGNKEVSSGEIVKELREVKSQNRITHWLLSGVIVLIAVWQFSEVSVLLRVKNKVTHPFKTVGSMFNSAQDALQHLDGRMPDVVAPLKKHKSEEASHPVLRVPELPYMDLPILGTSGEN
ncbi:hypothetical protein ACHQM5_008063 [Ranunculus cassubicifolius]